MFCRQISVFCQIHLPIVCDSRGIVSRFLPTVCVRLSWYREDIGLWYEDYHVGGWVLQDTRDH